MADSPSDIRIRRMTPADLDACMALKTLQGWNQLREDWAMFLGFCPRACFVACEGETLVGTLTAIDYDRHFAWIGMVLVHPERRRRGIGKSLLVASLEALADVETIKLDATPAGQPLYAQLGFVEEYGLGRLMAAAPQWKPQPAAPSTVPLRPSDLEAVAALDTPVFGTPRTAVLKAWYERCPQAAWGLWRDGRLDGYAMGRPGANCALIGPVIANNEADACALAEAVGSSFPGQAVGIDMLSRHSGFRSWLEDSGFVYQRPFTRMVRGPNRYPGQPARQWAVLGPEIG